MLVMPRHHAAMFCCSSDSDDSEAEEDGGDDESLPELEPNVALDELRDADTGTEFGMDVSEGSLQAAVAAVHGRQNYSHGSE